MEDTNVEAFVIETMKNICRNFGSEKHGTAFESSDPTAFTVSSIYVVMEHNGLGDTPVFYGGHPDYENPDVWIEDKNDICGSETGAYKVEIHSMYSDEISIKNIESKTPMAKGCYDGEWHDRTGHTPEELMKALSEILQHGCFSRTKPQDYKCTCDTNSSHETFDDLCGFCKQQEIDSAEAQLMRDCV